VSWFQNRFDARRKITAWRHDYNEQRPHSSLNYLTPSEFATKTSYAKVENACGVSHFRTATAAAG
jgi:putative transposase